MSNLISSIIISPISIAAVLLTGALSAQTIAKPWLHDRIRQVCTHSGRASTASQPSATAEPPVFKSGVELVALNVTVTDATQKYITDLQQRDFAVFEDGVQQDLSFFSRNEVPLDLMILLDTSASMNDKMPLMRAAAIGFARTLRAGDRGAVLAFNDGVRVLEGLTGSVPALEEAIGQTVAHGGTALHNAVYLALKEFARHGAQPRDVRRQAIVVLSDGQDTASVLGFDDVMDLARRSGVSIYTISVQSKYTLQRSQVGGRRYFSQSDYEMKTLALQSGGQAFFPLEIGELGAVYGAIARELSSQYSLGYTPKNGRRDGRLRRVIVRVVTRPDVRLRARAGYIADRETRAALDGSSR